MRTGRLRWTVAIEGFDPNSENYSFCSESLAARVHIRSAVNVTSRRKQSVIVDDNVDSMRTRALGSRVRESDYDPHASSMKLVRTIRSMWVVFFERTSWGLTIGGESEIVSITINGRTR